MIKRFNTTVLICLCLTQQLHATLCENTFGYISQPLNHTTGLMMLGGYRSYNAMTGNFTKQDGYNAFKSNRTFNGFNYAVGNPVLLTDRSGHLPTWAWGIIAVVGATFVIGTGARFFALKNNINALKTEVTSLKAANTQLTGQVTELQTSNNVLTGQVTDLQASNNVLTGQVTTIQASYDALAEQTRNLIEDLNTFSQSIDNDHSQLQDELNIIKDQLSISHFGGRRSRLDDAGFSQEDIQEATRRSMNPHEIPPSASGASSSWENPDSYRR